MKNTEQNIRDIFSNKLSGFESEVSSKLWTSIESVLPQAGTVAGSSVVAGAKILTAKSIGIAAAFIIAIGTTVYFLVADGKQSTTVIGQNNIVQQPATESGQQTFSSNTETSNAGNNLPTKVNEVGIGLMNETVQNDKEVPANQNTTLPNASESSAQTERDNSQTKTQEAGNNNSGKKSEELVRGGSDKPAIPLEFEAGFTAMQVGDDYLKFFFFTQYPDEQSYQWEIDGQPAGNDISASFIFEEEGLHEVTLTVTNYKGETKTSTQKIEAFLAGELVLQNIITPNGDDKNSFFDPAVKSKNVVIESLRILDTNGNTVYQPAGDSLTWDGNDRFGNPLPPATYFAVVTAIDHRGKVITKQEFVTLRR